MKQEIFDGQYVADYVREITPDQEEVTEDWLEDYVVDRQFIIRTVKIKDILETAEDFVLVMLHDNYEPRYKWSEWDGYYYHVAGYPEPDVTPDDLYNPVVLVDGKLIDGYSRTAALYYAGEEEIEAFVAI